MENLEQRYLARLNEILSKFDLAINIVNIPNVECQYRLDDNSLYKGNPYSDWLGLWVSVSDILSHRHSIFECLKSYHIYINNKAVSFRMLPEEIKFYQRYSEVYQFLQPLKSSCLEEFLIRCDLMGV
jgi:hypothetical protein